ncbi:MAG: hypothetical protein ACRCSF_02545 [Mycobacteriaceae bacterium]
MKKQIARAALGATVLAAGFAFTQTGTATAEELPQGTFYGDITGFPLSSAIWEGKTFGPDGYVINNLPGGISAFPASVYEAASPIDGAPVIIVDYGFGIHDELTPDGNGGYNGVGALNNIGVFSFTLSR